MKKTFCDCCEVQCINSTVIIRTNIIHHTSDGSFVGEDEFKPIEICKACMDKIKDVMPQAFILHHHDEINRPDQAMEAPVRVEGRHY